MFITLEEEPFDRIIRKSDYPENLMTEPIVGMYGWIQSIENVAIDSQ